VSRRESFYIIANNGESDLEITYTEEGYVKFTVTEVGVNGKVTRASVRLEDAAANDVFVELGQDFYGNDEEVEP
jgi:hypothetical protein